MKFKEVKLKNKKKTLFAPYFNKRISFSLTNQCTFLD